MEVEVENISEISESLIEKTTEAPTIDDLLKENIVSQNSAIYYETNTVFACDRLAGCDESVENVTCENVNIENRVGGDALSENPDVQNSLSENKADGNVTTYYVDHVALLKQSPLLELCRSSWHPAKQKNNPFDTVQTYLRGCKWSPDGTCCLTVINNGGVHLIELPVDLYEVNVASATRYVNILDSIVQLPESGLIYDFCWYPGMNSMLPESCCWLTTRQNAPVQMWDAFDGTLRCSYRGYNAADEVEPAISILFSQDALEIHAGYKKTIKTFRTDRPGREYVNQSIAAPAASMAVSPSKNLIAVGSWKTDISFYDIHEGRTKSIGKMRSHTGGVTHLSFTPDGNHLISGARKDDQLIIWDVRLYRKPLKVLRRKVETNQRIYFDISKCGKYLVSGGTDGVARVWDLHWEINNAETVGKDHEYPLHMDCCNGVSIHPFRPILASCSGQHHMSDFLWTDDDEETSIILEEKSPLPQNTPSKSNAPTGEKDSTDYFKQKNLVENSLEFWWTGEIEKEKSTE